MAKTFDELNAQAETIRTNVLPESNTAGLVGRMLKDIIEKVKEAFGKIADATSSIASLNNHISSLESGGKALEGRVSENESDLNALAGRVTLLEDNKDDLNMAPITDEEIDETWTNHNI